AGHQPAAAGDAGAEGGAGLDPQDGAGGGGARVMPPSPPRRRGPRAFKGAPRSGALFGEPWIPAFAGMTVVAEDDEDQRCTNQINAVSVKNDAIVAASCAAAAFCSWPYFCASSG